MQKDAQDVARMWQVIDALDFERIKAKLLHRRDGKWDAETITRAERGYRQFLKLSAKNPAFAVVPSEEVDEFWHAHIIDTRRYAHDCEQIFGFVLHHNPYVGIDGPEDEARLLELAAATAELMVREFGQAYAETAGSRAKPAYCAMASGSQAKPAYCAMASGSQAKPAYCATASGSQAKPAYCATASGSQAKPAYCAMASGSQAEPAYCATASGSQAKPAYCAMASGSQSKHAPSVATSSVAEPA
jgi:hypothetical protein